ncbi:MAG: LCP family protein [Candidatus Saccharibacteria bacterium]|nr:LCP family protein [Candidatus Saccharibacteria bacterium]
MNQHHRYKIPSDRHRRKSVDGLIDDTQRRDQSNPFAPHRNRTPSMSRHRLDDFKQAEGFNPVSQAGLGTRNTTPQPDSPANSPFNQDKTKSHEEKPHKIKKPKRAKRFSASRVMMKMVTAVFLVSLVSAGYLFGRAFLNAQQTFSGGVSVLEENIAKDGRINVLMMGKGGDGQEGPDLTDTILIASLDPVNDEGALVSIPRDLYVQAGPYGGYTKINAVFANAKMAAMKEGNEEERAAEIGLEAARSKVSEVTGVPIHYHVIIDFKGFERAIDIVGGVEVDVPEELAVYEHMLINGRPYLLDVASGNQTFDGQKALAFARSRKTSPRGDFDRSERQRILLVALGRKISSAGTYANPVRMTQLMDALGDHVRTSFTGVDELAKLYEYASAVQPDDIKSIGLAGPPNDYLTTDNIGGLSVVVPRAGLGNYDDIQEFLRFELRDGYLKSEDAKIAVYNAAGIPGLATRSTEDLKARGYTIDEIEFYTRSDLTETVIVDLSDGENEYTLGYLEERFGVDVLDKLPDEDFDPGDVDFVILLGANEQNRLQN